MRDAARQQGERCAQAFASGDADNVASFMPVPIVEKLGGSEQVGTMVKSSVQMLERMGMTLRSVAVGNVTDLKESHSQHFAVVPEYIDYATATGTSRIESFLLGISDDGGRTWKFVDGAGIRSNPGLLREIFPNFPDDLKIPERR